MSINNAFITLCQSSNEGTNYTIPELFNFGFSRNMISRYHNDGKLIRIARGVYKVNPDYLKQSKHSKKSVNIYENIVFCMLQNDKIKALDILRVYLARINKEKYISIIEDFIELGNITEDYSKVLNILKNINLDYPFEDVSVYTQAFVDAFINKRIKEAKCYLKIMERLNEFGLTSSMSDIMSDYLDTLDTEEKKEPINEPEKIEYLAPVEERQPEQYYGFKLEFIQKCLKDILSGKDFQTICVLNFLSIEEENILALIFAREFFNQGNIEMGNKYLEYVEYKQSTNVTNIYQEVIKKRNLLLGQSN